MIFRAPERLLTEPVRIQLIGCGGTGSQFADALASLESTLRALGHPGFRVSLHDNANVRRANLGRQRFAPSDIGLPKATLLAHRINLFYQLNWSAVPEHITPAEVRCDLLVTCTDSALFRAKVGRHFHKQRSGTLWMDFGNGAATGQVVLGHLGAIPHPINQAAPPLRLPNVFDLYPELAHMDAADRDAPSCSVEQAITRQQWPVNRAVANAGAALLWNLLRQGAITHHGAMVDTLNLTSQPMPIDPAAWSMYGYEQQGT